MQSVALYGRLVARALVAGIHNEFQLKPGSSQKQPLHLVTGSSGFSKSVAKNSVLNKWTFGDDAYFIARSKAADVIGRFTILCLRPSLQLTLFVSPASVLTNAEGSEETSGTHDSIDRELCHS